MPRLLDRALGTLTILAHAPRQRAFPYLDRAVIERRRDAHVREIVRFAVRTVPHYGDLARRGAFDPSSVRTASDLARIPAVTKDDLRADPERFLSRSRRARSPLTLETSGTTGVRLTIAHDRRSALANIAYSERSRSVISEAIGAFSGYREMSLAYKSSTIGKVDDFYSRNSFRPLRPNKRLVDVGRSVGEVIDEINSFRPQLLRGYGSYLEALLRIVHARRIEMHRPKLVAYAAEAMAPSGRAFLRELGIPVLSNYSAVEAFKIGFTCPADKGFHLHEDLCHVRVVDSRGVDLPDGEPGEVVISNLVNHGTVLLNYRLGDRGALGSRPCECGRTLRLLTELEGRVEDVIHLPDGNIVHPRVIWGVFKIRPEILRYQLIQKRPDAFELRLMTVDRGTYDGSVDGVLGGLSEVLGQVSIVPQFDEQLDLSAARKFRPVIALPATPGNGAA